MLDDILDALPQRLRVLGCARRRDIEGDRHDVVVAGGVISEVCGPAPGLGVVAAAPQ